MVFCLGEPPRRFLLYLHFVADVLHFVFDFHFVVICRFSSFTFCFSTSSFTLSWTFARFLHPFYTFSPAHRRVIRDTFNFYHSVIFLPQALRFWVDVFYPQAFFTLRSFTDIYDSTCVYQGFPGSRQFFLEVCRASYWSSKQTRLICLIHSNSQQFCTGRFSLKLRAARICEESAPRRIRTLSTISLACWESNVLSVWPQSLMIRSELKS